MVGQEGRSAQRQVDRSNVTITSTSSAVRDDKADCSARRQANYSARWQVDHGTLARDDNYDKQHGARRQADRGAHDKQTTARKGCGA